MELIDNTTKFQKQRLDDLKASLTKSLREIFQIDSPDLNFGVYRIMNQKRAEIEQFLTHDLVDAVDAEFGKYDEGLAETVAEEKDALRKKIADELAEDALTESGISEKYLVTKAAQKLNDEWKALKAKEQELSMSDVQKAEVFAHLEEFFSRYYKDGDFLSLRRYSRDGKYAVPYNGEEVVLHWANKDQYYVKSDSFIKGHGFDVGQYKVMFEVVEAEDEINVKTPKYAFVLCGSNNEVEFDEDTQTLVLRFMRRILPKAKKEKAQAVSELATLYPPNGKIEDIAEYILKKDCIPGGLKTALGGTKKDNQGVLLKHLISFTKASSSDFFIHKDLGKFLNDELNFYIKNEVFRLDDLGTSEEIPFDEFVRRAKILKSIAQKVIAFLAQLEEFQKLLWEKKKFVLRSDYCITVDHIPEEFYEEICSNPQQVAEWKRLYVLDSEPTEKKSGTKEVQKTLFGKTKQEINAEFLQTTPYVMVDTSFFSEEFKERLLESLVNPKTGEPITDLDEATGGLMIHSDNWQAMNLLQAKYESSVKCVYIDPPYNTGKDGFYYRDNYQDSCWASMMYDRLALGRTLMADNSVILSSIDDREQGLLRLLMTSVFGSENFVNNVIWQKKYSPQNDAKWLSDGHDFLITYAKDKSIWRPGLLPRTEKSIKRDYGNPDDDPRGLWRTCDLSVKSYSESGDYPITTPSGLVVRPPPGRVWSTNYEGYLKLLEDNRIWFGEDGSNVPAFKRFLTEVKNGVTPLTLWEYEDVGHTQDGTKHIKASMSSYGLTNDYMSKVTPKPVSLLKQVIGIADRDLDGLVLDYFAGTGGTVLATLAANKVSTSSLQNISEEELEENQGVAESTITPTRKYIVVEASDIFKNILVPRTEKFVYSEEWKGGEPTGKDGQSHIFKKMELEQYEDTLDNIAFQEKDGTRQISLFETNDYLLNYSLNYESAESACRLNVKYLNCPFEYELRTRRNDGFEDLAADTDGFKHVRADLVETFNYLLGLHVKRMVTRKNNGQKYRIVNGKLKDGKRVTIVWRNSPENPEMQKDELEADAKFIEETVASEFPCDTLYVNGYCFAKSSKPIEPVFKKLMGA